MKGIVRYEGGADKVFAKQKGGPARRKIGRAASWHRFAIKDANNNWGEKRQVRRGSYSLERERGASIADGGGVGGHRRPERDGGP